MHLHSHDMRDFLSVGKCRSYLLVKSVDVLMAKNNSLWFLRAPDEDLDLAASGSLDLRLRSDMQHNSDICLSGSNGRCAS